MNFSKLDEFLDNAINMTGVPGSHIVIHRKGEKIYEKKTGYSDIEKKIPIVGNETYDMYSCSKILTCITALTLLEKGVYHLDDPVSMYLPEYANIRVFCPNGVDSRPAKTVLTVRHLFSMTGGISYADRPAVDKAIREGKTSTRDIVKAMSEDPFVFDPGEGYMYSWCHDILGACIEVWSGKTLGEYCKEAVLDPLGMSETSYLQRPDLVARKAKKYKNDSPTDATAREPFETDKFHFTKEYESGGAGVISTVDDFIKLLDGIILGKVVSRSTLKLMYTPQLNAKQYEMASRDWWCMRGHSYGLGVKILTDPATADNNAPLGIFGWDGWAGSVAILDPTTDTTIFYAQHMMYSMQGKFEPRLTNVIYGCLED